MPKPRLHPLLPKVDVLLKAPAPGISPSPRKAGRHTRPASAPPAATQSAGSRHVMAAHRAGLRSSRSRRLGPAPAAAAPPLCAPSARRPSRGHSRPGATAHAATGFAVPWPADAPCSSACCAAVSTEIATSPATRGCPVQRRRCRERQHIRRLVLAPKIPVQRANLLVARQQDGHVAIEPGGSRGLPQERVERPLSQSAAEFGLYRGFDQDHGPVRWLQEQSGHKTTVGGQMHPPTSMVTLNLPVFPIRPRAAVIEAARIGPRPRRRSPAAAPAAGVRSPHTPG